MTDEEFDALLGMFARARSGAFWTPASVVAQATTHLGRLGAKHVLDVGAGVGKFCLLGAQQLKGTRFHGIDRRAPLVAEADALRRKLGLERVSFTAGDALAVSWSPYDAFYFFNPFSEHLVPETERLDDAVELSRERFAVEAARIEVALRLLPPGRVLVTYHGLAGPIPSGYDLLVEEPAATGRLRVWRRAARRDGPFVYLETAEGIVRADRRQFARILLAREPDL
jgi:hypothetical protein